MTRGGLPVRRFFKKDWKMTEMKKYVFLFSGLLLLCACMASCSSEESLAGWHAAPGVYDIEMDVSALPSSGQDASNGATRGIADNQSFDNKYDPDVIYLHKVVGDGEPDQSVLFSLHNITCTDGTQCYGFNYRFVVYEDGSGLIQAYGADGELVGEPMEIAANEQCYFSSVPYNEWRLSDSQVEVTPDVTHYKRNDSTNVEIYRSADNFSIDDLATNTGLVMHRGCAGFNLLGLFYDQTNRGDWNGDVTYTLTEERFEEVMGSPINEWYIKIYVGGEAFPSAYNLGTQAAAADNVGGGYYASGDSQLFHDGQNDSGKYLKLSGRQFGNVSITYRGQGYFTQPGNHLFTPVLGESGELGHIYVFVKHWDGEGEPDDDWLLDDTGALMTEVDLASGDFKPTNNSFYNAGLIIEISEFKEAWDGTTSTVPTRTSSGATVRKFTLKNPVVVFEEH